MTLDTVPASRFQAADRGINGALQLDDCALGRELSLGHLSALESLYDRYAGLAMALACRLLDDRQSAEDVVQESFLEVWRHAGESLRPAGRFDPNRGALRAWLLTIVRHKCIDHLRHRAAGPQAVTREVDIHTLRGQADTWADVEQRLTADMLRHALIRLPAEQQTAIRLAYFGAYSHREIAERLNLPLGTVKGRIRLGMAGLRAIFGVQGDRAPHGSPE